MTTEMTFGLLGPLAVSHRGKAINVTAGRQRVVLAALLFSPGQVLACDDLAEMLWGPHPPPSARVAVQNYVMRLRRILGDGASRISTWPGGYAIDVAPGELDLHRAAALLAATRDAGATGAWHLAADRAGQALALWRGQPLADVPSEELSRREGPGLAELRLQALELRIDAELHLGDHASAIGELRHLAGTHPLRERFHELLVRALHRDGRRADALAAYQDARRVLIAELGVEPGEELRKLHAQVLSGHNGSAVHDGTGLHDDTAVPRQLPASVPHFTGRETELAKLSAGVHAPAAERPGVVMIRAVDGMAGVGKTALAVHGAHRVAARFPDGQLYVNLRGYDPERPMPPADALAGFLGALGVPGPEMPAGLDERAARFRGLVAGRRMLIVLDNASDAEQVRPLLPAARGCAVIVTSRDKMPGLVARDGAVRVELDLMSAGEAVALLESLIGPRAKAEPSATATLAARCCGLPLALRVAAELAVSRPQITLTSLSAELADQQRRLDLLDAGGDSRTAVRAVFSWSCRHLDAETARAFRLSGLHPGPDLDVYAVAALAQTTAGRATWLLRRLDQAHLIQWRAEPGRHALHDLLRDFAAEQAVAQDGADACHAAMTRLLDYYARATATAVRTLHPAERGLWPDGPPGVAEVPPLDNPASARAWLDAERPVLAAVAAFAANHGRTSHALHFSMVLYRYLDTGGHYPAAIEIHTGAYQAAHRAGDLAGEAAALSSLGVVAWRQGRYAEATSCLQQVLALCRANGDKVAEARALQRLGLVDFTQGNYEQATTRYQGALARWRQAGDQAGEARALGSLGGAAWRQGRYDLAREHLQQALALHREVGDPTGESEAMGTLAIIALRQGRYRAAADQFRDALALCLQTGNRIGEADALTYLGITTLRAGDHQQAADHLRTALDLSRQTGDRPTEAYVLAAQGELALRQHDYQMAERQFRRALDLFLKLGDLAGQAQGLNGLGGTLLATGWPGHAHARHTAALTLASQIGDPDQEAHANDGLGHAFRALGDLDRTRFHWQQALARYTELGAPEAARLRVTLADL